jgi:hypothetical protein
MRVLDLLIATIAGIGTGYYIFNDTFKQLGMKLRQKNKTRGKNSTNKCDFTNRQQWDWFKDRRS